MNSIPSKHFEAIGTGAIVTDGSAKFRVTHLVSGASVLAVDVGTGQTQHLQVEALRLVGPDAVSEAMQKTPADRDLLLYSDKEWKEAERRFAAIKPLLALPVRTIDAVARRAHETGISQSSLYRWLRDYQRAEHLSALVPQRRGRKLGSTLVDEPIELIMQSAIEDIFLTKQRRKVQDVVEEVMRRCRLAQVVPPHPNTVRNRVARIDTGYKLRRRGRREEAENRFLPIRGAFPGADFPLAVVQIDHTPLDVIVVDEMHRKPVGRPYMTLAIDVYSRMVAGMYVSMEAPGAAAVGLCLAQAMCPKREYLAGLGVPGEWPLWGKPHTVHCDNAKEFRGGVLERGCQEYGINLEWRPVKTPRYGGHIERLVGTVAREIHKLPGTTFSNPKERRGYNSEAQAALTLRELETHLTDFFVNVYHQRVHSELGTSPRKRWELGVMGDDKTPGTSIIPMPRDRLRVQLDFMPYFERTIQRYGIQISDVTYYDPLLDRYIGSADLDDTKHKRKFVVRRDPRDISKIYFFDPADSRYYPIPYSNVGRPAVSEWELRDARKQLRDAGRRDIDEQLIFDAIERRRAQVAEAVHKSKQARRQAQRDPTFSKKAAAAAAPQVPPQHAALPSEPHKTQAFAPDDLFSEAIEPFEGLTSQR